MAIVKETVLVTYFMLSLTLKQVVFNKLIKSTEKKKYMVKMKQILEWCLEVYVYYLELLAFFELIATVAVPVTVTEFGDKIQKTHH